MTIVSSVYKFLSLNKSSGFHSKFFLKVQNYSLPFHQNHTLHISYSLYLPFGSWRWITISGPAPQFSISFLWPISFPEYFQTHSLSHLSSAESRRLSRLPLPRSVRASLSRFSPSEARANASFHSPSPTSSLPQQELGQSPSAEE